MGWGVVMGIVPKAGTAHLESLADAAAASERNLALPGDDKREHPAKCLTRGRGGG